MKRLIAFFVCSALLISLLAGCGSVKSNNESASSTKSIETESTAQTTEAAKEPIKLKYLGWVEQKQDAMEKLAKELLDKKNIQLEFELLESTTYNDVSKARLASGDAPDIMACNSDKDFYGKAGYLMDLKGQPFLDLFKDGIIDRLKYQDQILILPAATDSFGLYYNKDLFKQLGLEAPKTFPALVDAAKKIKDGGKTAIAMPGKELWAPQFLALGLWGACYDKSSTFFADAKAGKVKYSSMPEFQGGMEKFKQLVPYMSVDALGIDWAKAQQQFYTGEAAMIASGTWMLSDVRKANPQFEVGFMSIPYSDQPLEKYSTQGGYTFCLGIPASVKNKDASLAYIDWFFRDYYKTYLDDTQFAGSAVKGIVPTFDPILADFDSTFASTTDMVFEASVQNIYFKGFQEIIGNKREPKDIMQDMDKEMEKLAKLN